MRVHIGMLIWNIGAFIAGIGAEQSSADQVGAGLFFGKLPTPETFTTPSPTVPSLHVVSDSTLPKSLRLTSKLRVTRPLWAGSFRGHTDTPLLTPSTRADLALRPMLYRL